MAPPPTALTSSAIHPVVREVTEDTPPDLLEGTMDLLVVLPSQKSVRMTVNRRTPMMDLLIQVTTAHKINPGGHIVQVRNERGIELPYKPSTPIGALDTTTIEIVPKNRVNEYIIVKKPAKLANQPFEQTFRLQVHLPRNQLYVMRVSPKTLLEDILLEVCQEKNLDHAKYEMRHPVKLDEKLPLSGRVGDFGLQELTVVSRNSRINNSVSAADIMALQNEGSKGCLDSAFKHSRSSVGDSSVSSESAVSARGISPSRSDDSRSISPLPPIHAKIKLNNTVSNASSSSSGNSSSVPKSAVAKNNFHSQGTSATMQAPPRTKKRAAPPPPSGLTPTPSTTPAKSANNENSSVPPFKPTPRKKDPPRDPPKQHPPLSHQQSLPIHHSRHSSDSSGYHESSILSEQHEPSRLNRQVSVPVITNLPRQSGSTTNLTSVYSGSSTSLASSNGGIRKRKAPKPPAPSLKPQRETPEEELATTDSETSSSISQSVIGRNPSAKVSSSGIEEVKVDVHVESPGREIQNEQIEYPDGHEKDIESLSSSSASSLSSPTSGSESNSSSPLPVDSSLSNSQNQSPVPHLNKSSRDTSPIAKSVDATATPGVEESSRPSSASNTQAMDAAPLPPPRTKPRLPQHSLSSEEIEQQKVEAQSAPQPKPKPRPDRKSTDTVLDTPTVVEVSKDKPATVQSSNFPVPPSSGLRNPLAKFGVKVLPDNALHERLERMSKKSVDKHSSEKSGTSSSVVYNSSVKTASSSTSPGKSTKISPEASSSSSAPSVAIKSEKSSKGPPSLSKSNYTGKGSVRSIKSLHDKLNNQEYVLTDIQIEKGRGQTGFRGKSPGYESDDLEENLELFEVESKSSEDSTEAPSKTKISVAKKLFKKKSSSSFSSHDSSTANSSSSPPNFIPELSAAVLNKSRSRNIVSVSNLDEKEGKEDGQSPLTRTLSDRKKVKKEGQLNRWQNFEALHELDDSVSEHQRLLSKTNNPAKSSAPNKNPTVATTKISKSTFALSTDGDNVIDTVNGSDIQDDPSIHSSGSEVSYTDSGIPATANVTPSPIDIDVDVDQDHDNSRIDKDALSEGSSRRSSLRSENSDQWRDILQAKLQNDQENVEKAFESMMPDNFSETDSTKNDASEVSSNFEMVRPQSLTNLATGNEKIGDEQEQSIELSDSTEEESPLTSEDDYERSSHKKKSSNESAAKSPRKLSKSESFSHNSEFEVVKMKRRTFGGSRGTTTASNSKGSSTTDLRKSSFVSSSEEDLSVAKVTKRSPGGRPSGSNSSVKPNKDQRTTSMQNLNNPPEVKHKVRVSDSHVENKREGNKEYESSNKGSNSIQKATSMLDIQEFQPDIADPELLQKYRSELEAQMEQWKEQFLQKHLGGSRSDSFSKQTNNDENVKSAVEVEIKRPEPTVKAIKKEPTQVEWDEEEFDPEKPQIVHAVAAAAELNKPPKREETFSQSAPVPEPKVPKVLQEEPTVTKEETEVTLQGEAVKESEMFVPKQPVQRKEEAPVVYKYAGPPTINMTTWGDRPKRNISVKKDKDYITGFGQQDPKSVEIKPATAVPVTQRVNSFHGTQVNTGTTVNKATTLPPATKTWLGVGSINGSGSTGNNIVPNVVSSWKQRIEESEKERKSLQPHPQEIDIYGDGFSLSSNKDTPIVSAPEEPQPRKALVNINKSSTTQKANTNENIVVEEPPNPYSWGVAENNNKNSAPAPKRTLVNFNKTNKGIGASTETINAINKPEPVSIPTFGNSNTLPSKPGHSLVNINKLRTIPTEEIANDKPVVLTVETNTSSNSLPRSKTNHVDSVDNGMSMQEKKKFFQGIKPVESNGKEAPIPAVNMKNSIATISRVFQQTRQQQMTMQKTASTRDSSSSNISSPASSGTSTPVPNRFLSDKANNQNSQGISSTEMVQKLLGKSSSFNIDNFRRTPSPASSTTSTSTMSSASPSSERHTPSPTISDGPNNTIRISTGSATIKPTATSTIKNVGNKSIIIVSSADDSPLPSNNSVNNSFNASQGGVVSNSIFKQQMKVNGAPSINITSSKKINPSPATPNNQSVPDGKEKQVNNSIKFNVNSGLKAPPPVIDISMTAPVSRAIVVEQTAKKIQPSTSFKNKIVNQKSVHVKLNQAPPNAVTNGSSETKSNSTPAPPPPPPIGGMDFKTAGPGVSLSVSGRSKSVSSLTNGNSSNGIGSAPTSPTGSDPRSEIFSVIKNSGGNFGLKKTGSPMFLK